MSTSVAEFARVLGFDDPLRVFHGVPPIKQADRERARRLHAKSLTRPDDASLDLMREMYLAHLPTILRAQVESTFRVEDEVDDVGLQLWRTVVVNSHHSPSYARFLRTHPYASRYYKWLVKYVAANLPSYEDLELGIPRTSNSRTYRDRGLSRALFADCILPLFQTFLSACDTDSPIDFLFPPSLLEQMITLICKLSLIHVLWNKAGQPQLLGDAAIANQMMQMTHRLEPILLRFLYVDRGMEVGSACAHWANCDVTVNMLGPPAGCGPKESLKACSTVHLRF